MPTDRGLHGWVVIDKPQGLTSSRIVEHVRRATGAKAGHAGTLDPLATGVLPIALGEATKTTAYAMRGHKCYRFNVRWGIARATDDCEGDIVGESGKGRAEQQSRRSCPVLSARSRRRRPPIQRSRSQGDVPTRSLEPMPCRL